MYTVEYVQTSGAWCRCFGRGTYVGSPACSENENETDDDSSSQNSKNNDTAAKVSPDLFSTMQQRNADCVHYCIRSRWVTCWLRCSLPPPPTVRSPGHPINQGRAPTLSSRTMTVRLLGLTRPHRMLCRSVLMWCCMMVLVQWVGIAGKAPPVNSAISATSSAREEAQLSVSTAL